MKNYTIPISILFLLLVLAIIGNIVLSAVGLFFNYDVFNTGVYAGLPVSINVKLIYFSKVIALLLFVFGVYILVSKIRILVNRDFFSLTLIKCFSNSGNLFLISGIIGFLASIFDILNLAVVKDFGSQVYLNIDSKSLYIMLMILGLFFLMFSRVLNKGKQIQQENDLTI